MPKFTAHGRTITANRFLVGHPAPQGAHILSQALCLKLANGDKRLALWLQGQWLAVPEEPGSDNIFVLRPGDWMVATRDGRKGVMRDEVLRANFKPFEEKK